MIVILWCNQIILGKKTYNDVPAKLKDKVKERLISLNRNDLIQ